MARHKNIRTLITKYAQNASQSEITIQPRCFYSAKTLKLILNIFDKKKKKTLAVV
jgi:hypothetical protein